MWNLPLCMLMHRPLLCRVTNHKEISGKLKKCISNKKKFYKYLKNLQIFFLEYSILPCAQKSCSRYVKILL